MTKAEELKILDQIAELIKSAGADSYICMTFDGITDVCRSNIENDFGNQPVRDLADERMMRVAAEREAEMAKKNVDSLQKMCDECLSEVDELRKLSAEWEQNAHDAGDLYCELEKECAVKDVEICNLKAEIVHMKLERMTYAEYAELYESMRKE